MERQEEYKVIPLFKEHKKKMFMTPKEFSQEYQIGINKTYEIINVKGFPVIKNGTKYLIIRSKVEEFFLNNVGLEF